MKFYVASKWENKEEVRKLMYVLIEHGHTITEDWTHSTEENNEKAASADFKGVHDCDVFIGLFDKPYQYKGALVEFGMALAFYKPVVVIGHGIDDQTFIHLPLIRLMNTVEDFISLLPHLK